MTSTEIILNTYRRLIAKRTTQGIPINLRIKSVVGTVQDDPFDCWVEEEIKNSLPNNFDVYHSGALTTPDLIIRDRISGLCIGLEIKKLIQKQTGADSRGLTIDYNSCLPCGSTLIKILNDTSVIPCYFLFALLNYESTHIVSLILLMEIFSIMTSIFTKRPNMLIILSTTMVPMEKVLYDIEKCIHTQTL